MTLREIADLLDAHVACGHNLLDRQIDYACASDLMSDVLTLDTSNILLITGLVNLQAIRTAEMSDTLSILFVRNKKVPDNMLKLACENNIVIMEFKGSMFHAAGVLYKAGIKPVY
jgi:predicted transcriptional regulator